MGNFCRTLFDDKQDTLNIIEKEKKEMPAAGSHTIPTSTSFLESPLVENCKKKSDYKIESDKLQINEKLLKAALDRHNQYRKRHCVPDLKLNLELCRLAQKFAEELANSDEYAHSESIWDNKRIGENLAIMIGKQLTGDVMTDIWYDEHKSYNFKHPGFSASTGYFTQMIWKDTKEVGFGVARGQNDKWIGIANYYPSGNIMKEYENNVFPIKETN